MENFLVDAFVKVIGHCTHKHTLGEVADFGSWDETVHLCGNGSGFIIPVDGHGLALLKDFTETFREGFGCFSHDLTTGKATLI